jgi:peptidoglycan/xylan/chitin deacetylase (PgdA/CDA1 family)
VIPTEPRSFRSLAQRLLKRTAATADRVRPPAPGVIVLIYHRVGGGSGLELDLPVRQFEAQMEWLAETGRATTLDAALVALESRPQAANPVVVTFDDGTADFADEAVPVLERFGIPATLYLATAFVHRGEPLPYGAPPVSWSALRDIRSTGLVSIGSHTHTHSLLDRLPAEEIAFELDESIRLIEDELVITPAHFAYPKALDPSPPADAAVRARFRSAALAGTRPNRYGVTDPYRLARSPVQASDGLHWFRAKVAGGMAFEDDVRRVANRIRYRGEVS